MRKKNLLLTAVACGLLIHASSQPNTIGEEEVVPVVLQEPVYKMPVYNTLAHQEMEEKHIRLTEERLQRAGGAS